MPALQKQAQAVGSELQSLEMAAVDEARYLQLAENLAGFRSKLRSRADTLDVTIRQQILRLVVKEVLVGTETITLRHSLPIPQPGPASNGPASPSGGVTRLNPAPDYLLRSGSQEAYARCPALVHQRLDEAIPLLTHCGINDVGILQPARQLRAVEIFDWRSGYRNYADAFLTGNTAFVEDHC